MKRTPCSKWCLALILAITSLTGCVPSTIVEPQTPWILGEDDASIVDIKPTADGGFIVAGTQYPGGLGYTSTGGIEREMYLAKLDEDGNVEWWQVVDEDGVTVALGVQQTTDGGYIMLGAKGAWASVLVLTKTDADGDIIWTTYHQGEGDFFSEAGIQQTSDGGFILAGSTYGDDMPDTTAFLLKTGESGEEEWSKIYQHPSNDLQSSEINEVIQIEGAYILAGTDFRHDSVTGFTIGNAWLMKVDATGEEIWSRHYAGSPFTEDKACGLDQTADGGYVIAERVSLGYRQTFTHLRKTDELGYTSWVKTIGTRNSIIDLRSVTACADGGYAVVGDWCVIKTDTNGNQIWNVFVGPLESFINGSALLEMNDGSYLIGGSIQGVNEEEEAWLRPYVFRLDADGNAL